MLVQPAETGSTVAALSCSLHNRAVECCLQVGAVAKLGVTVLLTMALLWLPYLGSIDSALSVVRRVFPTKRGLYEDYVANFWWAGLQGTGWGENVTGACTCPAGSWKASGCAEG